MGLHIHLCGKADGGNGDPKQKAIRRSQIHSAHVGLSRQVRKGTGYVSLSELPSDDEEDSYDHYVSLTLYDIELNTCFFLLIIYP